jgi:hypothetical protein
MIVYEKFANDQSLPLFKKFVTQDIEPKERMINLVLLVSTPEGWYEIQFSKWSRLEEPPVIQT